MQRNVRSINFNEDCSCFTCCPENGALIFNVNPLAFLGRIDGERLGSLSLACMLGRSNVFALVGGGKTPKFAENAVIIWDEAKKDFMLEFAFSSPVLNVVLRKHCLVVVLQDSVQVFDFPNNPSRRLTSLDTWSSCRGLVQLAGRLLAFPSRTQAGWVQLAHLDKLNAAPVLLQAHQSELAALRLSLDGELLATASTKGTLVRVYRTGNRQLVRELRRGADHAVLYSLAWSPTNQFVCATSDKGTVHIWPVNSGSRGLVARHSAVVPAFLPDCIEGTRATVTFALPPECRSAVAFAAAQSVVAVSLDGAYRRYTFTATTANREAYDVFVDMAFDSEFC